MSKKTYRDIIYFDTDKIQSILAQINKGLINSMMESNSSKHEGAGELKSSKLMEILLSLPISAKGSYKHTRSKGLQEEKSLHDFALTELLNTLPLKDVTLLNRDAFGNGNKRTFVKVKGSFSLYDYEDLARTIERIEIIDSLIGNVNEKNEEMKKFANFIKTAYEGLTAIEVSNKKDIKFLGAINTDYLRETMRNLLFKYGGSPKGEWEMICQITNIPKSSSEDIKKTFDNFGKGIDATNISKEKSLNPFMNEVVKEFSKINDMFSSVSHPNISVEPIAVYKEMIL